MIKNLDLIKDVFEKNIYNQTDLNHCFARDEYPKERSLSHNIAMTFGQAANQYDSHAHLQKHVAHQLSDKLNQLFHRSPFAKDSPHTILEIGCGTGFLTHQLLKKFPQCTSYTATDIAPSMVKKCHDKLKHFSQLNCLVKDGQDSIVNHYDWIVSSLAFQWFEDMEKSLRNLWEQTDTLAFTTLVQGTLQEWGDFCEDHGCMHHIQAFITKADLMAICQKLSPAICHFEIVPEIDIFDNPLSFLRGLKAIGAHTSTLPTRQSILSLKSHLKNYEGPFSVTYQVAYCILQKK